MPQIGTSEVGVLTIGLASAWAFPAQTQTQPGYDVKL